MSAEYGYLYRICPANEVRLREIIGVYVGAGSTFGGAAQWDFDTAKGRDNLRPITDFANAASINVSGDFGHAFSKKAEVRWKRRDDGAYDILVLSEQHQAINDAQPLCPPRSNDKQQTLAWVIQRYTEAAIVQTDNRSPITYIDYLAPNGAVQFQRFVEVK